jgi:glycosyltransferase involved in cell wall biosynthesis
VSGARNTGIAAAHGQWIAFLDDDDLWAPRKLHAQLATAETSGAAWVYAGDVTVDEQLRVISGAPPPAPETVVAELRRHNAVPAGASNVVVRRDLLGAVGTFDPQLRTSEDWDLWLRLAAKSEPACVRKPLVALRTHGRMASRRVKQVLDDIDIVSRRYNIEVDWARHQRWAAWMCLEDGNRRGALRHYGRADPRRRHRIAGTSGSCGRPSSRRPSSNDSYGRLDARSATVVGCLRRAPSE